MKLLKDAWLLLTLLPSCIYCVTMLLILDIRHKLKI